ncbi:MAG: GxxExxY protein [Candidatus Sulfotelmatobacter sp.]
MLAEELKHRELTERIIGVFYDVYNELGHGFLESVYEQALALAFSEAGMKTERQGPVSVWFRSQAVGDFRADMSVEGKVLIELKAARTIEQAHEKQLLNYLRATDIEVGLLLNLVLRLNFGGWLMRMREKRSALIRVNPRRVRGCA